MESFRFLIRDRVGQFTRFAWHTAVWVPKTVSCTLTCSVWIM